MVRKILTVGAIIAVLSWVAKNPGEVGNLGSTLGDIVGGLLSAASSFLSGVSS